MGVVGDVGEDLQPGDDLLWGDGRDVNVTGVVAERVRAVTQPANCIWCYVDDPVLVM